MKVFNAFQLTLAITCYPSLVLWLANQGYPPVVNIMACIVGILLFGLAWSLIVKALEENL